MQIAKDKAADADQESIGLIGIRERG